jgi:hypothetical protein
MLGVKLEDSPSSVHAWLMFHHGASKWLSHSSAMHLVLVLRSHNSTSWFLLLQVVVDAFDPSVLVSDCATHVLDFATVKEEELYDIHIPLNITVGECSFHGNPACFCLQCW